MPITLYITCPSLDEAKKIARVLVGEGLAAGANLVPAFSIYRWRGEVVETDETILLAQSREELFGQVCRRVRELHSYECPCLQALPVSVLSPDFHAWIDESCTL